MTTSISQLHEKIILIEDLKKIIQSHTPRDIGHTLVERLTLSEALTVQGIHHLVAEFERKKDSELNEGEKKTIRSLWKLRG
jgi:hypothetical protein